MGDDDALDALRERRVDDRERVVAAEVRRSRARARAARSSRSTSRVSRRHGAVVAAVTRTGSISSPRPRSSCWSPAQIGTLSPGFGSVRPAVSAGESKVGIQTIRAPSRAAISTASGFMPPTARLSVSVPITRTPGTTPETTCARSAVEV